MSDRACEVINSSHLCESDMCDEKWTPKSLCNKKTGPFPRHGPDRPTLPWRKIVIFLWFLENVESRISFSLIWAFLFLWRPINSFITDNQRAGLIGLATLEISFGQVVQYFHGTKKLDAVFLDFRGIGRFLHPLPRTCKKLAIPLLNFTFSRLPVCTIYLLNFNINQLLLKLL